MNTKCRIHKKKPEDYPTLTIRLPSSLRTRIDALCGKTVLSRGQIVVMALNEKLGELERRHASASK